MVDEKKSNFVYTQYICVKSTLNFVVISKIF